MTKTACIYLSSELLGMCLETIQKCWQKHCLMAQRQKKTWLSIQKEFKTRPEMTSSWPATPILPKMTSNMKIQSFPTLMLQKQPP